MFRFDSAERAHWEPASGVSLQVFDMGAGSVLDSLSACTGPWQYLQRIVSARSVRAS
jgi:hypothetical protein